MYEAKMKRNENCVAEFIDQVPQTQKREDAWQLLRLFEEVTGYEANMWGPSIIGFGSYHYKYASGHEGDAPLVGFSPRKGKITLYLMYEGDRRDELLKNFGKFTQSKACIYINKLADIDIPVLGHLIKASLEMEEDQAVQSSSTTIESKE